MPFWRFPRLFRPFRAFFRLLAPSPSVLRPLLLPPRSTFATLGPTPFALRFLIRQLFWDATNPHSIPPGQPCLWDDPNLFFGPDGLGYAREPGDPGFVPYGPPADPLSSLTQPKRRKTMPALFPPIPATPAKWTYKAIFRVGDQRVGQWSDEVSLTVGG